MPSYSIGRIAPKKKDVTFMKLIRTASSLLLIGFAIGCSNTPIDSTMINASNPQKITITSREKPDFEAWSRTYDQIPFIGIVAMYREGNKIVKENGIDNPAKYIGQEIAELLSNKYGIKSIATSEKEMISWEAEDIIRHYPNGGLIVDVQTINWGIKYIYKGNYHEGGYKYRVFYAATLRILDSQSKSKIAEGYCKIFPKEDNHLFARDQLIENSASVLQSELKFAADHCLSQFSENVIKTDNRKLQNE